MFLLTWLPMSQRQTGASAPPPSLLAGVLIRLIGQWSEWRDDQRVPIRRQTHYKQM